MKKRARLIAFYLPQFHPIPENDIWWEKGFTEWTNVTRAKPLFSGHVQPKLPGELGFYDLRVPDVREAQARLAHECGIEGFCYWHYWLGEGRRLLERPFDEVLRLGEPDFPFCLGWANHNWEGKGWMGGDKCLAKQTYPGREDATNHFEYLLRAFTDERYICVDGQPLLVIYRPNEIPDCKTYLDYWRKLAKQNGLADLYIIGDTPGGSFKELGLDGVLYSGQRHLESIRWEPRSLWEMLSGQKKLKKIKYKDVIEHLVKPGGYGPGEYPVIIPNWDTSPRIQEDAIIFYEYSPQLFSEHVEQILTAVSHREFQQNIVFVRAWNEWAEGNYLEPDQQFGRSMLDQLRKAVSQN